MADRELIEFGEGLWYAEENIIFFRVVIQTRMIVAALPDGGLALITPLKMDDALARALDALGKVRHALSPNKIHNLGLDSVRDYWPEARLWASPGLEDRCPTIAFDGVLGDRPHSDWAGVMDQLTTRGNTFFSEVVFFHRHSATLIVADLVENFAEGMQVRPWAWRWAHLMHIWGRALPSPEFRAFTDDANAVRARLDEIDAWPFEHILMAHGVPVHGREAAHAMLRSVRDFLVEEVQARPRWKRWLYRLVGRFA